MAKILLVEDDPLLIDIYTTKLKQVGFEVDVEEDGDDVFPHAEKSQPDVILLDIVLPHTDGWEILEKLQEGESTKHIPIFVLSNLGQKEEIEKGLRLGATKYLIKAHYTPSEVVREIEQLLGGNTNS
jgi:two-component system, OmpR family, response regulator